MKVDSSISSFRSRSASASVGSVSGTSAVAIRMTTTASAASRPRMMLIAAQDTMGEEAAVRTRAWRSAGAMSSGASAPQTSSGDIPSSHRTITATSSGRPA